jgi:hypothetical protein
MSFLEVLISLAMALDGLWTAIAWQPVEPTKADLVRWTEAISPAFVEIGVSDRALGISAYYVPFPGELRGSVLMGRYILDGGCDQVVGVSTRYRYPHDSYYGTPDVIAVAAHEAAHVYQGMMCLSRRSQVETEANIAGLAALAALDDGKHRSEYRAALVYGLRYEAIAAALDLSCDAGMERDWLDELELSEAERGIYENVPCRQWQAYGDVYSTAMFERLLSDSGDVNIDLVLEDALTPSGIIDASGLREYLELAR